MQKNKEKNGCIRLSIVISFFHKRSVKLMGLRTIKLQEYVQMVKVLFFFFSTADIMMAFNNQQVFFHHSKKIRQISKLHGSCFHKHCHPSLNICVVIYTHRGSLVQFNRLIAITTSSHHLDFGNFQKYCIPLNMLHFKKAMRFFADCNASTVPHALKQSVSASQQI